MITFWSSTPQAKHGDYSARGADTNRPQRQPSGPERPVASAIGSINGQAAQGHEPRSKESSEHAPSVQHVGICTSVSRSKLKEARRAGRAGIGIGIFFQAQRVRSHRIFVLLANTPRKGQDTSPRCRPLALRLVSFDPVGSNRRWGCWQRHANPQGLPLALEIQRSHAPKAQPASWPWRPGLASGQQPIPQESAWQTAKPNVCSNKSVLGRCSNKCIAAKYGNSKAIVRGIFRFCRGLAWRVPCFCLQGLFLWFASGSKVRSCA